MANLLVDERDQEFVLYEQLQIETFSQAECFKDFSREIYDMVLSEAQKLSVNVIAPTNAKGDEEGCRQENGKVLVPESFHDLWSKYNEGGWLTISDSPEVGGQGMPVMINIAASEYFIAANPAFSTYPGLTSGAARLIQNFGTEEQQKKYMENLFSGKWGGTMVLTEPGAGSDVGALKTTAKRLPDGTFSIAGTKIFISAGDHNLTENIIHPVLAKIEGAPAGTRGISIFIVPKIRVNDDGTLGEPNDVNVGGVEHKMGIKGSSTCLLNYGDEGKCIGELLGEENSGMRVMFQMMNEARLGVGHQGAAVAGTSYLHAVSYARERIQGPDIREMRNPEAPKVPIINHPDIRRMLLGMKAYTEGFRALNLYAAYCFDQERMAADEEEKRKWDGMAALLTPVCKAYCSDMGFRVCETAMQVYGGYGYIHEYPVEQFMRDQKIASIYEGTNGIQALDLVARKLGMGKGTVFINYIQNINQFCDEQKGHELLGPCIELLTAAKNALADVTFFFAQKGKEDVIVPVLYATPYLEVFGDVTIGWLLLWQAVLAQEKFQALAEQKGANDKASINSLIKESRDAAYYSGKVASARFFANTVLNLAPAKAQVIKGADKAAVEMDEESFG
jgi:alkylation response protein AidB-like acyl-CoA dehydrogenase